MGFEEGQYMFYNFEKQVDDPDSVLEVRVADDISLFRLRRSRKLAFTGSYSLNTTSGVHSKLVKLNLNVTF